ncbi:4619_t:CDS:2 [Dentiscutata erythropus]|uniref:4619_t:CDS:1 n=1 Tax=Dentiscutata erythropus TaxID=1348616 RepID=A0A9N9GSZ8_9GLOM|nr:4619_t:CDS:2 [Dentiscutata erythropus]
MPPNNPAQNFTGKNQISPNNNNPTQNFTGQNQMPPNNPTQNVTGQNQVPVNISAKNFIRQNAMSPNDHLQYFFTHYAGKNQMPPNYPTQNFAEFYWMPTNNIAQNFVTRSPIPPKLLMLTNNFVGKNYLSNGFVQNQAFSFTQQRPQAFAPVPNAIVSILLACPLIQQCQEVKERYNKECFAMCGYEYTTECHAGYYAGFGDVEGLRHHFTYGAKFLVSQVQGNVLCVSNSTGETALHYLYKNKSLTKDLYDSNGLQKLKEAIEFLVDNGCIINAMDHNRLTILSYYLNERFDRREKTPIILVLLKKGADPNIPSYNAPNALFLAVKIGDNLLVLAARERRPIIIDWILETIPETSTRDSIEAAMKPEQFLGAFYASMGH